MKNEQEDASTAGSIDPDPATAAAIAAALNEPPTTRATRSSKRTADAAFPSSLEEQAETKKVRSTANSNNNDVSITEGQMPKGTRQLYSLLVASTMKFLSHIIIHPPPSVAQRKSI